MTVKSIVPQALFILGWSAVSFGGWFLIGMSFPTNNAPFLLEALLYTLFAPAGFSITTIDVLYNLTGEYFYNANIILVLIWSAILVILIKSIRNKQKKSV